VNFILIIIVIYLSIEIFIFLFLKKYSSVKWLILNQKIKFDKNKFNNFKKNIYNEKLGWDYKYQKKNKNLITKKGFRKSNYSHKKNSILAFGDSYTYCRQVKDNQTWEEMISKKKNTFIANYGVGNYGLDQAFLKFNLTRKRRETKVILFGFVPETICRIQSSWKNYLEFGNLHGFKPSVELIDNKLKFKKNFLRKNISFLQLSKLVEKIKDNDRFYKDKFLKYSFSFPYFFSFTKNFYFNLIIFKKILLSNKKVITLIEEDMFPTIMENNIKFSHNLYVEEYSKRLMNKLIMYIFKKTKKKKLKCYFIVFPQLFDLKLKTRKNYQNFFKTFNNNNIIDLTSVFLKQKNIKKLFINDKYGGHLSKKGNQLVAKELLKKVNFNN